MSLLFSLAFLFISPPHVIELEDLDERARVTSCLRERFLFFLTMFLVVCSRGWCLSPGLQPSECCSRGPSGMFVCAVFYYAIFF